ncbi:ATP synthase subunit gamma, mitochondrial-like [Lycorma delicatula]|uniref:ATP synthase subunit gamma, mitochondrial-like n=1 Tax=Lycorma delicatula TaxID=130591 RepID=UPI003F512AE2
MSTLKIISDRLKSVTSIQKITKSMKMVSVAKYARAERLLKSVRPFGLGGKIFFSKAGVEPPDDDEVLIFAVTSDRGLCGSCHANVAKFTIRSLTASTKDHLKVVCVGEKVKAVLQYKFREKIIMVCKDIGKKPPSFLDACMIGLGIRNTGFMDKCWIIVYNNFKSMISYETAQLFIPSAALVIRAPNMQAFDDVDEDDVNMYVQFSKVALLFYAMVESSCSEHSARMTAMDTATNNAGEMIGKLRLTFNRGRQASITRELIEIISGAAALKGED